jgi:hypothetical protein
MHSAEENISGGELADKRSQTVASADRRPSCAVGGNRNHRGPQASDVRPNRFDHEVGCVSAFDAARQAVGHIGPNEQGLDVMQPTDALRVEIRQQEHHVRAVPCQAEREHFGAVVSYRANGPTSKPAELRAFLTGADTALRHRRFHDLVELNQAIRELLIRLDDRPFRKRDGSRSSVFAAVDRPALRQLPGERFDLSQWSRARVNIDYHFAFDGSVYSVPYALTGELIEVRSTASTVEVFHKSQRVTSHLRARTRGQTLTNPEHRPRSHQAHLEWTPSRMVHWAETIGPFTARLFERIMAEKPHPEMAIAAAWGSSVLPPSIP